MNSRDVKPFWKKLFSVAVILFSVCMILLIVINSVVLFFEMQNETDSNLDNMMSLSDKVMYSYLNQYDYSLNDMSIVNILVDLSDRKNEYISYQQYRMSVEEKIKEFYFSLSGISGISYRDNDNTFVSIGQIQLSNAEAAFETVVNDYQQQRQSAWRSIMIDGKSYLAYYKNIGYLDGDYTMVNAGDMVVFVDDDIVYEQGFAEAEHSGAKIIVLDGYNNICCGGFREYVGRGFEDVFKRSGGMYRIGDTNTRCYIKHIPSSVDGWKIVGVMPVEHIYTPIFLIIITSLIVALFSIAVAMVAFYKVSNYMNEPLMKLSEHLQKVEDGNYDEIAMIDDKTEIGYLYYSFNNMIAKLNKQFNENYLLNLKVKEAYIQALEKQINPHFIFNTLQLIQMITLTGRTDDAFNMCGHFGEVIRFNLHDEVEVQIEDEIENLISYFKILEFRYYGEIKYTIDVPENVKNFYTIKFLLQPIIENSIQHAFIYKDKGIEINVLVRQIKDEVVFIIKDNGVGMTEEMVSQVMSYIDDEKNISKSKSIGLKNVNQRIKLLYGEQFGIRMYSTPNKGTTVLIHLPVCESKKYIKEGD
ncbi:MAG: histidine kinase [Eubacteriales bacterium]|nr:histidine kinase [Eubacteriales bacterium]